MGSTLEGKNLRRIRGIGYTTSMTLVTNHVIGDFEGAVNQMIRPGGDWSIQNVRASAGLGFFNGADGPTQSVCAARAEPCKRGRN